MEYQNTSIHTALITGASRGLGRVLALELARRGWRLVLDARTPAVLDAVRAELAAIMDVAHIAALPGDVNDPIHRAALVQAAAAFGGLDALINNAGTLGLTPRPNLLDYPLTALAEVYQINVVAPLGLIQDAHVALKTNARILNITSDAAAEPYAGWGGYGSSKAALEQLTAILAAENPNWRVYSVDPGDMRTQMHQDAFPGEDISDRPLPEESVPGLVRLLTEDLPGGRYRAKQLDVPSEGVTGLRVVLTIADFDKAVALYRDGLHLSVVDQWIAPESKGILLDAGRATLELVNEAQALEVDKVEVGERMAGQVRLSLTVGDVNEVASELGAGGATSVNSPVLTPWGHLNQRFEADAIQPGVQITLSQVVEDTETAAS